MPMSLFKLSLVFLLLILVLQKSEADFEQWCVADEQTPNNELQAALDWACGKGGADCSKIQMEGPCYVPNTVRDHASYAFNDYYQNFKHNGASCNFNGAAITTELDPKAEFEQYWCVAVDQTPDNELQAALDWACGKGGADCSKIQIEAPCFEPNTVRDHASYAFNSYYQKFKNKGASCYFNGAAISTEHDPSHGNCHFEFLP